jgi:hypothetical protein
MGETSTVITFNVGNAGGTATGILATAFGGANATEFTATDNKCVVPLVPLASCTIAVVFKPASVGNKVATLTVTDPTPGVTPAVANLTGVAANAPVVSVTGTGNVGDVVVGKPGTTTLTVTNTGGTATGPLTLAAGDPQFVVGGACAAALAPTATCIATVTFTPTTTGTKATLVTVSSGATVLGSGQVQGNGISPPLPASLDMTPVTLDFGTIGVGTSSLPQSFTVTNKGGLPSGVLTVTNAGVGGASQFSSSSTCTGAPLAPAATCQVVVTFKPTVAGNASANFTVSDGTVSSQTRNVVGSSIAAPGVTISCPQSSTFEDTVVGQTSPSLLCTVTNDSASLQPTGALTVAVVGDFATTATTCSASLVPGGQCTVTLVFKPTLKGDRTGTVTVTGTNGGTAPHNLKGAGLGVVEIQEFTFPSSGLDPVLVAGGNYDFGTVSAGATSETSVILAVFVRGRVGNLTVNKAFGSPADFTQGSAAVNLAWTGSTATSVAPCILLTTTEPTPNKMVPYCTVVVSFTPQTRATAKKTGTVTATGADTTATDSATVQGSAGGPISITPSQVTFGTAGMGTAGTEMTLTVCNNSATLDATNANFGIAGTDANDFAVTLDQVSNATIAPRSCVNLAVRLDVPADETAGALRATLTVNATVNSVVESDTATLVGTAAGAPALQALPANLTFEDTAVTDTSAAVTVTVSNTGGVETGGLTFTIPSGSEFTMNTGLPQGTCGPTCASGLSCTAPALAAGTGCTMRVWFKPTGALGLAGRTDTLTVASDSGGLSVLTLSANAVSQLSASPATVTLDAAARNDDAAPTQTVTIANRGAAEATLSFPFHDFGVAQTGSADFRTRTGTCGATLAGGATCTIGVQMHAGTLGTRSTTMVVTNTDNGQNAMVTITGTTADALLQFAPASAVGRSFGTVRMGDTSQAITYTVRNVGGLTSGGVSFGIYDQTTLDGGTKVPGAQHDKASDFLTTGTTCAADGTLAPGASCDIKLAFHPTLACDGGSGCGVTGPSLAEFLVVKAAPGTDTAGLISGGITAGATTASGVVYIADASGKAVYDFGVPTATVTFTLYNGTNAVFPVPVTADVAIADIAGLAGTVTGDADRFTIPASTGTGTCAGFGGAGGAITSLAAAGNAGDHCTFRVTWTPPTGTPTRGTRAVVLTMAGVSANMVMYARVLGQAVLTARPASLDFGVVSRVGDDSPTRTVTITNTGESTTPADLQSPTVGETTTTGCRGTGSALDPGDFCVLVIDVQPSGEGAGNADVVVRWGGTTTAQDSVTIHVTWAAVDRSPAVITRLPTTSPLAFGSMPVMATSAQTILTLRNAAGNDPTGPMTFTVNNADFAVKAATGTHNCGDPAYLADGLAPSAGAEDYCRLILTFTPRTLATPAKEGQLAVRSKYAANLNVDLTGTAKGALSVAGYATATTAEDPRRNGGCTFTDATGTVTAVCDYGTRGVTTPTTANFRSETYSFQNAAGSPATGLLEAKLTGADAGQYRIVYDTCTGISLLSTDPPCKVTVRFSPTSNGDKNAASLVVSGIPGDSIAVRLNGTGG